MDWFQARGIHRTEGETVLLSLPDIRQTESYDCGAAAIDTVLRFHGSRARWDRTLANPVQGMAPDMIEAVLRSLGFELITGPMMVADLKYFTRSWRPVVCPCSDWGGHWVVVRGVERGRVHFHCPLRGAVSAGEMEWRERWADQSRNGVTFDRWGIAVGI